MALLGAITVLLSLTMSALPARATYWWDKGEDRFAFTYCPRLESIEQSISLCEHLLKQRHWRLETIPDVFVELGGDYAMLGKYATATAFLEKARAMNPRLMWAYINLAHVYTDLTEYRQALDYLDDAVRIHPESAIGFNESCWVRAIWGQQLDHALSDCNQALKLAPEDGYILDSRGFVYFRTGRFKDAIADFDAALKTEPKLYGSFYVRGLARAKLGDRAGAEADIAAAAANDPKIADRYAGYGVEP